MYLEIQRLSTRGTSGCVRLYSAHPQHHYLVLEDHGADLRALLKPSLRYPQQVLEAVVSAVHALHSLGIMHGDIKPQNLLYKLYDHGYVVKICDLDAAHRVGDVCQAASLGTAQYHAPELRAATLRGDTIMAALELDMFALGLVMQQVLARSPHAALDCAEEDALYASQEQLDVRLNYPPLYRAELQRVTCINPAHRMNIADLYRAIKTLSASSAQQGWLHEKVAHQHLQQAVGTQLGTISEKLDRIDAKLDRVLQELRTRFDALGSSALEVAESLRKEILLGNQQVQVLPEMIRAAQDALQRLSQARPGVSREGQSPATTSKEMEECLSSMQASIAAAVSRALAEQRTADTGEFPALAAQLQGRFTELSDELRAHLQDQQQSSAQTAQQLEVLGHTSACLKAGLAEVLHGLRVVQGELTELKNNQAVLGKQIAHVLATNAELNSMVRALTANTHGMPTLAVILPVVSTGWKSKFSPMRLVRDQYRLYFLCSHTKQLAPCGPSGKGYKITMTKQWVLDAAPVLRVGLVLVKVALLASGLPLPVPDLCSALVGCAVHCKYLDAALQLVAHPPDGLLDTSDLVLEQTLDAVDTHDYSDLVETGDGSKLQEGSRKAYETIKEILGRDGVNIPLTCGLRQVTHRGKTAWVLDNDATEQEWKLTLDSAPV
jgi:serine/threonine protein kinase